MIETGAHLPQAIQPTHYRVSLAERSRFRPAKGDPVPPKRFLRISLVAVLLLAAVVRFLGLSRPLVGPFATKNAIYAMIARNWACGRAPFWLPTIDCLAGGERGLHLLELPLVSYLAGAGWAVCGGSLDVWGRAVSLAFSVAGVALLYVLVRRWHGERPALGAAIVLALSPISMFCGQSFMLESSAIFFMLLAIWSFENWLATARWRWWLLTAVSIALMLCTKIYLSVMLVPLAWLAVGKIAACSRAERHRWVAACLFLMAVGAAPAASWCLMVARITSPEHPLAEHVYYSLWHSTTAHAMPNPLLWSAEFHWRLLKGLAGSGLTPIGFLLAAIGLCHSAARRHVAWMAAMTLLVVLLPGKFFELRYYLLVVVPLFAVLAGLGCEQLARQMPAPRIGLACCFICGLASAIWLAAGPMWRIAPEDRAVTTAAAALRGVSSPDEPVATLHGAAPDLLYYCDRRGWALSVNDPCFGETLDRCRRQGARWLVVADLASLAGKPAAVAVSRLPIEHAGDDFVICPLMSPFTSAEIRTFAERKATDRRSSRRSTHD